MLSFDFLRFCYKITTSNNFTNVAKSVSKQRLIRIYQCNAYKPRKIAIMSKRDSVTAGLTLAGCCFSICKKKKDGDDDDDNGERSKLLASSLSPKKTSQDELEIGAEDMSKSVDTSGAFPNVFVSSTDKKSSPLKNPAIVSFKADITNIVELEKSVVESVRESVEDEDADLLAQGGAKKKKKRPNYFVALQITNPQILEGLKEVQDCILKGEPKLKPALVSLKKLHITLMVFHAEDNQQLELASEALAESFKQVTSLIENSIDLEISKVSNFKNQVVFAGIKDDEQKEKLFQMTEIINCSYEKRGFNVREAKTFHPHLTLFKLSQAPKLAKKGIRKIDPQLYEEFNERLFGIENVKSLQLLDMNKKDEHGYYHCVSEFVFGNT